MVLHGAHRDLDLGAGSGSLRPRPRRGSRWDAGQVVQGTLPVACAHCSLPALLPLLKAHRFSHSLEKAGQEWLSTELAMGQA